MAQLDEAIATASQRRDRGAIAKEITQAKDLRSAILEAEDAVQGAQDSADLPALRAALDRARALGVDSARVQSGRETLQDAEKVPAGSQSGRDLRSPSPKPRATACAGGKKVRKTRRYHSESVLSKTFLKLFSFLCEVQKALWRGEMRHIPQSAESPSARAVIVHLRGRVDSRGGAAGVRERDHGGAARGHGERSRLQVRFTVGIQ